MSQYRLPHVFPGWITNFQDSPWLFICGGILLLLTLSVSLFIFVKKKKKMKKKPDKPEVNPTNVSDELRHDEILKVIKKQNGRLRSLLLAANSLHDLPVTIPVNLAVCLARTHKCLLVDLDIKRNAIAQVFELDTTGTDASLIVSSYPTQLENLSVWPAHNFGMLRQMNLRTLFEGAVKKYDYVLIYAPYLTTLPDRRQIAACAKQAITFSGDKESQLIKLLEVCNCKVIAKF